MKLSPQQMTLFQLKGAIKAYKSQLDKLTNEGLCFTGGVAEKIKQYSRYRSALKVCEFTLQRKTDELKLVTLPEQKKIFKTLMNRFSVHLGCKFSRLDHDRLFKDVSDYIQNFNEL